MKNASSAFKNELKNDNRNYIKSADLTLHDGTVLHVDNSDMWNNGLTIEDATSNSNSFDIGSVIIGSATLVLNNIYDDYSAYDFTDCIMDNIKVGLKLPNNTVESIQFGKYYLESSSYNGSIITLNFYDGISKFDKDYSDSNLTYPASLREIVQDACDCCGITLGTPSFDNDDYVVDARPESDSLTFRQILMWVAQISCNYCRCDVQGRLCLQWYDVQTLESLALNTADDTLGDINGSDITDHAGQQIATIIEGKIDTIATYSSESSQYQSLSSNMSLSVGTDDVVITGIRISQEVEGEEGTETVIYQSGTDGYVLSIDGNKLVQGDNGPTVASMIAAKTVGVRFRTFQSSSLSDPTIEAGDVVLITDRKGRQYKSLITNTRFNPGNLQDISCGAVSPARNSASRYSQITQVYVDYRQELEKERTDRETALEELADRMDNSSGLFTTEEIQPDGSTIFYLHNKPQLSESDIVWKMTAEAWGVSTDGGKTYNAGMTVDGDTIVRILTATGVNADWIQTGAISVEDNDGNETFYADTVTGAVRIVAQSFSLQGKTVSEIAEEEVNDFVDAVYTPAINNLQEQIDGQVETWFCDYVPTTENIPASEWTTDTEKDKHLGDLFYVVDNSEYGGQAYRWAKINNEYTWDYVEDTAVVKALADAADAKDTADQKRRVFVTTPYPPYDVGDLWVGDDTSDLMRCQTARSSGNFNSSDWIKAVKYTDNSDLYDFISGEYQESISNLQEQSDQKAETWYQATDPSSGWSESEKEKHNGDLWYNTSAQKTYIYNGTSWEETKSNPPDDVFDQIDGKAQIFVNQPSPPYNVGDLWFNSSTSDIMTCIVSRQSGAYTASDWEKRNKYTDDSYAETLNQEFNQFISEYQDEIVGIQESIDQKAEVWYQPTDPSVEWSEKENTEWADVSGSNILDTNNSPIITIWDKGSSSHNGDLWKNSNTNVEYIYQDGIWVEMPIPDDVFDTIDGKAQIFVNTPSPPYSVGDLWFNSATSDIMTCINSRDSGNYSESDWEKRNKYTDDSKANEVDENLNIFADSVTEEIASIQTQVDGKIETFYYDYEPTLSNYPASEWTTDEDRQKHIGDLFYWDEKGFTYRFQQNGTSYVWQPIQDSDITEALNQAAAAQDTADRKRRVFITTPVPPYDVGDLWAQGDGGDIMRCIVARSSGSYVSTDWDKASKYTDDTAVDDLDNALDQEGVFNRLTNNGQTQGIYLQNNRIYINATYIRSGTLSANLIKGGILTLGGASNGNGRLEVLNSSNQVIGTLNNTGVNLTGVFQNRSGQEFVEMDESILKGGYGSTVHGRIDLSAQYDDGSYKTVVEALSSSLILKSLNGGVEIVRTDGPSEISKGYAVGSIDGSGSTRIETIYITQSGGDYYAGFQNTQNTVRFAILTTSDAKLKKNIKDTEVTALDYINQIQHKSFDLKEGTGHKDCGYIAQDLQKIYPGFVVEAPEYNNDGEKTGGTLQVNTFAMLPYITKAIQELSEENRKLKEEIKEIKKMIQRIGG